MSFGEKERGPGSALKRTQSSGNSERESVFKCVSPRTGPPGAAVCPVSYCKYMDDAESPPPLQIRFCSMPPHIRKLRHGAHELIVNGQPFLCRAGELNNSSFSDPLYMCATWNALAEHDVNVVLAAVGWEDIEPKEGEFDFATLDENIIAARSRDMKLVLLWFGSHKNGESIGKAMTDFRSHELCSCLGENESQAISSMSNTRPSHEHSCHQGLPLCLLERHRPGRCTSLRAAPTPPRVL